MMRLHVPGQMNKLSSGRVRRDAGAHVVPVIWRWSEDRGRDPETSVRPASEHRKALTPTLFGAKTTGQRVQLYALCNAGRIQ